MNAERRQYDESPAATGLIVLSKSSVQDVSQG